MELKTAESSLCFGVVHMHAASALCCPSVSELTCTGTHHGAFRCTLLTQKSVLHWPQRSFKTRVSSSFLFSFGETKRLPLHIVCLVLLLQHFL